MTAMKPVVRELGQQPTKANLMAAYTGRVRSNIHMVLCMRYSSTASPGCPEPHPASSPDFLLFLECEERLS